MDIYPYTLKDHTLKWIMKIIPHVRLLVRGNYNIMLLWITKMPISKNHSFATIFVRL